MNNRLKKEIHSAAFDNSDNLSKAKIFNVDSTARTLQAELLQTICIPPFYLQSMSFFLILKSLENEQCCVYYTSPQFLLVNIWGRIRQPFSTTFFVSFSNICKLECNTTSDWLNRMV